MDAGPSQKRRGWRDGDPKFVQARLDGQRRSGAGEGGESIWSVEMLEHVRGDPLRGATGQGAGESRLKLGKNCGNSLRAHLAGQDLD